MSVKTKSNWQGAFDAVLGVDRAGVRQVKWGAMLPVVKGKCEAAINLMMMRFDDVSDWWQLCEYHITRTRTAFLAARHPATANPDDFWVDPARLRLAEHTMGIIFATIGHDQSRSTVGSFR